MIQNNKDAIENQRRTMIKEVKDLKKKLTEKIQTFNVDDTDLTQFCRRNISVLDDRENATTNAIQSIQNEMSLLDQLDSDTVTPNVFLALQKIAENTNSANKELNEVSTQHQNVRISYVPNSAITSFLLSSHGMGEIKESITGTETVKALPVINFPTSQPSKSDSHCLKTNQRIHLLFLLAYIVVYVLVFFDHPFSTSRRKSCDIFDITVIKESSLDVKQSSDSNQDGYIISEMIVTANGTLLITDYRNKELKALSSDGAFISSLSFSDELRAINLINPTTAVVSTSDNKLQFINISFPSELSVQTSVSLGYTVVDLTVYNNKVIVIAWSKKCMVKMLDLGGNEIWSTSSDSSGQPLLKSPDHIITKVINGTATVIVTDWIKNQIVFIDVVDGKLLNTIDVKGKGPAGLAVDDDDDNVYISYWKTSEISVWSSDFSKNKILLRKIQLQGTPRNIIFTTFTGELFISYHQSSIVDRFNVTCSSRKQTNFY